MWRDTPQYSSLVFQGCIIPAKAPLKVVLLGKRAEVFAVGVVVLVVKISTTGSGQAGGPAHYHTVSFLYLLYQTMDLFAIRQRLFVSQLIRRTARKA